jgi:sulfite reductase alpha subunit-like flavoprotein
MAARFMCKILFGMIGKLLRMRFCGDGKGMAHAVEDVLTRVLGEAKGGSAETEGVEAVKLLKERSRLMLDVWS